MSGTNWKKLSQRIPTKVQINKRVSYEVVKGRFDNPDLMGESRPQTKQLVLREGMAARDTVTTYLHELLHAVSDVNDIGLTETQVNKLEKFIYFALKSGNVFTEDSNDR